VPVLDIASALALLLQGDTPLLFQAGPAPDAEARWNRENTPRSKKPSAKTRGPAARKESPPEKGMQRYRIEVGHSHEVKPGNIVGAIANEAGIDSEYIGRIDIHDDYSLVDLPEDMPKALFKSLKYVWVSGQQLKISHHGTDRKPKTPEYRPKVKTKARSKDKKKSRKKKLKGKSNKPVARKTSI
jgi:ATP-dependent RNA helicase DeaD